MKCLSDNIIVIRGENQSERKGILLPDSAQEESNRGEVICIGPDVKSLKVGDTVLVPLLAMMRVKQTGIFDLMVNEKPALVLNESDVAVVWPQDEVPMATHRFGRAN